MLVGLALLGGQLPPVGVALAQAQTITSAQFIRTENVPEAAPLMTPSRLAAGHRDCTQGSKIWVRLDCAAGLHWQT